MFEETATVSATSQYSVDKPPLKKSFMLIYSSGQVVEVMIAGVVSIFLLYYLTSVCGLRPDIAGLVLFISLAIDAVADPLIGASSDGWKSQWGRRHPFMLIGLIVLPISIIGVFILPTGLSTAWIFWYVLVFNILMRLSMSFFVLAYAALLPEFSSDYEERSRIMIYRLFFSVVAMAAALWLSFEVFFKGEDTLSQASSYVPFAFLLVGIILSAGLISTFGTLPAAKVRDYTPETHPPMSHFFHEISQLFQNPSFVSLFFGVLVIMTAMIYVNSLNLHVFKYYWDLTPEQMKMPTLAQPAGMLLSIPLSMWLIKVVEKRTMVFFEIGALAVAFSIPVLLKNLGFLSSGGLAALSWVIASGAVYGMCMGFGLVAFGSMIADATDEHDVLFKIRREGLYFAALVLASKVAMGLGGMLAGFGLQLIGFPSDSTSPEGAAQLTPQMLDMLGVLWGPVFATGVLLSVPFFLMYRLDRKAHQKIMGAITSRNEDLK